MQLAMSGMVNRLCTLEADKLTNTESSSLVRARMDRLENGMHAMEQQTSIVQPQNAYLNRMESDDRCLNLVMACLTPEMQSVEGIMAFALERLHLRMTNMDIVRVYKIADSQRGPLVKVRFGSLEARTVFYKSRTSLGPSSTTWVNEDLINWPCISTCTMQLPFEYSNLNFSISLSYTVPTTQ